VRQGDWKLVYPLGGPWELYQIPADPVEGNNLAARFPARVEQMGARWDEWFSILPPSKRPVGDESDSEGKTASKGRNKAKL
jgi:hypothetical protein